MIIEAVDAEYIEELKKEYVGYKDETPKTLLNHIKSKWCKITTREKGKALQAFREPLDQICNFTTYE